MKSIAILGTVGVPASYGGFETLAENLIRFNQENLLDQKITVYCSSINLSSKPRFYLGAKLRYIKINANGVSSIAYDILSLLSAIWYRNDVILLLGVSGAISLPLIRILSSAIIVTNVDGVEWKREKWKGAARWFLKLSEKMAVNFSHDVIADNEGIAEHINQTYGRRVHVIAYGGDQALSANSKPFEEISLPARYALSVCRIEPENNIAMILEAFASKISIPLVFVGNWNNSNFGIELRRQYALNLNIHMIDPIYDIGILRTLRENAFIYIHGHSAGGTNPSLVEMMHFGIPILSYDCVFNRFTTEDSAIFFKNAESLRMNLEKLKPDEAKSIGNNIRKIALKRYTWAAIGKAYFDLLIGIENFPNKN